MTMSVFVVDRGTLATLNRTLVITLLFGSVERDCSNLLVVHILTYSNAPRRIVCPENVYNSIMMPTIFSTANWNQTGA